MFGLDFSELVGSARQKQQLLHHQNLDHFHKLDTDISVSIGLDNRLKQSNSLLRQPLLSSHGSKLGGPEMPDLIGSFHAAEGPFGEGLLISDIQVRISCLLRIKYSFERVEDHWVA